jgi:hypothetical protein
VADRQFTTVPGAVSCRFQVIPKRKFAEAFLRRLGTLIDHPVVKYHDADGGFLCPPLPVFLEEDKGPDYDVLPASRIGGHSRFGPRC